VSERICLHFREPTIDTNRPIADGTVGIDGFEMELTDRATDADAWDCGFAARMLSWGQDHPPCVSIPAFPNRKFRQAYIYVNERAGIATPRDLEGKRVGIRAWANTAGVWARGGCSIITASTSHASIGSPTAPTRPGCPRASGLTICAAANAIR